MLSPAPGVRQPAPKKKKIADERPRPPVGQDDEYVAGLDDGPAASGDVQMSDPAPSSPCRQGCRTQGLKARSKWKTMRMIWRLRMLEP